jgi:sec-independent protein translocase protein TatA
MTRLIAFGMPAAPEWVFISILALVLFGPKKLPEIARGLGKALGELQKAKEDFHREITGVSPLPKIQPQTGVQPVSSPTATPENQSVSEAITVSPSSSPAVPEEKKI